ncbi:MAG: hypothetical protein E7164_01195 [Firmicutes bacterium]|nr:hypothetical protein [Bacillota bacterium]
MILKKPYAFLIKYYRIIHLALAFLLAYGALRLKDVVGFFNEYVGNGYTTTVVSNLENLYTPISLFIVILCIMAFAAAILVLLSHKKKKTAFYVIMEIYYLVILLGLSYVRTVLIGFETELIASTLARSLRDVLTIVYIPQFVFILFILLRTIGFNVKKFSFKDEIKEMGEDHLDSEEFEVSFDFDAHIIKQKVNRFFREMFYYIKENRFIVLCIVSVVAILTGYYSFNNIQTNYDTTYKAGTKFTYNQVEVTFEDAIISNLNYRGKKISDKYYVVIKTIISNDSGSTIPLDFNNFRLHVGGKIIMPNIKMASEFIDYAPDSVPVSIAHKSTKTFALVYEIEKKQIRKNIKLKIYNGSVYNDGKYNDRNIFVKINPLLIPEMSIVGNYSINQSISLDDTYIGYTKLTINNYTIEKKYIYLYEACTSSGQCQNYSGAVTVPITSERYKNKILVLPVEYKHDPNTLYGRSYTSLQLFAENFVNIQYKIGDSTYSDKSINVTPQQVTNFMAFEVPAEIEDASIIQAVITVRNKRYFVNLKVNN